MIENVAHFKKIEKELNNYNCFYRLKNSLKNDVIINSI